MTRNFSVASPDFAPRAQETPPFGTFLARSALTLMLAGCTPISSETTPDNPETFTFPSGTAFYPDPTFDANACGTLIDQKTGTRVQLKTLRDPYGTTQHTFGGYSALELGLCAGDPDGLIWHDEGLQVGQLPANH
jgi:hypothetical protein